MCCCREDAEPQIRQTEPPLQQGSLLGCLPQSVKNNGSGFPSDMSPCSHLQLNVCPVLFADPWMIGAAASAFYINDAATVMPKAVVAKARTYIAGAYADVLEVRSL